MTTSTKVRYKTGETCVISGTYAFDGYVDGTWTPAPTAEEREIDLTNGETFPPIKSAEKACWWTLK